MWVLCEFYNCVSMCVCLLQLSTLVVLPRFRHLSLSLSLCVRVRTSVPERYAKTFSAHVQRVFSRLRWFSCFYLVSTFEIMQIKKKSPIHFLSSWFEHLGIRIVRFACTPLSVSPRLLLFSVIVLFFDLVRQQQQHGKRAVLLSLVCVCKNIIHFALLSSST